MKSSLALLGFVVVLALPTLGSATTLGSMTWNFVGDVRPGSTGVSVGSSHLFGDLQGDATTICASVDPSLKGFSLYEKKQGGDENGLGVSPENDNEINAGKPGIELNFSSLLALDPSSIFLSLNSLTGSEVAEVTYLDGNHDGDTFAVHVFDEKPISLDLVRLNEDGGSILITADKGNILIAGVSATTTPEPAGAGLMGIGLVAAGFFGRKPFAKQA